jgi:hypothetical protein
MGLKEKRERIGYRAKRTERIQGNVENNEVGRERRKL